MSEPQLPREVRRRLAIIHHAEEVTGNVTAQGSATVSTLQLTGGVSALTQAAGTTVVTWLAVN